MDCGKGPFRFWRTGYRVPGETRQAQEAQKEGYSGNEGGKDTFEGSRVSDLGITDWKALRTLHYDCSLAIFTCPQLNQIVFVPKYTASLPSSSLHSKISQPFSRCELELAIHCPSKSCATVFLNGLPSNQFSRKGLPPELLDPPPYHDTNVI